MIVALKRGSGGSVPAYVFDLADVIDGERWEQLVELMTRGLVAGLAEADHDDGIGNRVVGTMNADPGFGIYFAIPPDIFDTSVVQIGDDLERLAILNGFRLLT